MAETENVGTRQLQALLERINAGDIAPGQLGAFMHAPSGPIIADEIERVTRVPDAIVEPKDVRMLPGVGMVCAGYDRQDVYRVESRDRGHWLLWSRSSGKSPDNTHRFVGMFDHVPLWYRPSDDGRSLDLYQDGTKLLERLGLSSTRHVRLDERGIFLAPDGQLYLWLAEGEASWLAVVTSGGKIDRSGNAISLGLDRFCLDHKGRLIATGIEDDMVTRSFLDPFTGGRLGADFANREEFVGFWVTGMETCAIGRTGKGGAPFVVHLTGSETRAIPNLPKGEIIEHKWVTICSAEPKRMREVNTWKVAFDGKQMYAVGAKLQPARFDVVSDLFEEDGQWFYWGLAGKHLCLTRLVLSEPKKA